MRSTVGNGVVLWVYVDDLDEVDKRARRLDVNVVAEPYDNPLAHRRELTVRDPDGYSVALVET